MLFATAVFAWGSFRKKPLHAVDGMQAWVLMNGDAGMHRDLRRLLRRRHRFPDTGGVDGGGPASAHRRGDQERTGDGHECFGGGDLRILKPGELAGGVGARRRRRRRQRVRLVGDTVAAGTHAARICGAGRGGADDLDVCALTHQAR